MSDDYPRKENHPNRKVSRDRFIGGLTLSGEQGNVTVDYNQKLGDGESAAGDANRDWSAGPYKTDYRAEVAGNALIGRIEDPNISAKKWRQTDHRYGGQYWAN